MVSGMPAIAVIRCSQNSSVPVLAEPSPRTRPNGVRMFMAKAPSAHPGEEEDHPQEDRAGDRADDIGEDQPFTLIVVDPDAEIPDEVAHAAEQVMQRRPGEADQDG